MISCTRLYVDLTEGLMSQNKGKDPSKPSKAATKDLEGTHFFLCHYQHKGEQDITKKDRKMYLRDTSQHITSS